ncbi:LysR family transcriptional regulator [Undibacterium sp. Ren11W]|uniref:LysR family transcriptional regulator n=1 Tax=Undibacterium sp. Ren11W TaxID=3413045 RepID=UPI003BEF81F0
MNIELRQLRYFLAVAEEMHFGRAANKLHMTQPPLSQAIQVLEENIGAQLFIRTTRSIALTAAGLALIPEAKKILQQAVALPQLVQRAAAGEIGELSLAFISIADYSILPPFLRQFRHHHKDVRIELREATSNVQLELLEKSEVDAGLLIPPIPPKLSEILNYQKVLSEPLILAVPEIFSSRKNSQYLSTYADLPLIIFPRKIAPSLHDTILGCFRTEGLTPAIAQEAIQMQTIIGLVSAGMGIALVPQSVSNLIRPGVVYYPMPNLNARVEIGIAWRKENTSPVLKSFLDLLKN